MYSSSACSIHGPCNSQSLVYLSYVVDPRVLTAATCTCRSSFLSISPLSAIPSLPVLSPYSAIPTLPVFSSYPVIPSRPVTPPRPVIPSHPVAPPRSVVSPPPVTAPRPAASPRSRVPAHPVFPPYPGASQLPNSPPVVNVQNTHHYASPSPIISTLADTQPSVNRLVALRSDPHYTLGYDVSKDVVTARVYRHPTLGVPMTPEERYSLVIEGVPYEPRIRIVFEHSILTSVIELEGSLTVGGLLEKLHSHLDKRISSREKSNLAMRPDHLQTARVSKMKRCEAMFDPHVEWDREMKRVDVLGNKCMFYGIYLEKVPDYTSDYFMLRVIFRK